MGGRGLGELRGRAIRLPHCYVQYISSRSQLVSRTRLVLLLNYSEAISQQCEYLTRGKMTKFNSQNDKIINVHARQ